MHSLLTQVVFYIFAALAVLSALMVITQSNSVRSVLFLVLTFFASAVLWMMLGAEFLSLILVLVYVGAVMTLFLFVVMMLNMDKESVNSSYLRFVPFGLILVAFLVGLLMKVVPSGTYGTSVSTLTAVSTVVDNTFIPEALAPVKPLSNTEALGQVLYTDYVLAFELAAAILLVAIVAAITLTHRHVKRAKRQDVVKQIMTQASERLEIVHMETEKY